MNKYIIDGSMDALWMDGWEMCGCKCIVLHKYFTMEGKMMDGWMDGWMEGWSDGWMDAWMMRG
jgi:hypothetical protein